MKEHEAARIVLILLAIFTVVVFWAFFLFK